jgi:hypothetical protein
MTEKTEKSEQRDELAYFCNRLKNDKSNRNSSGCGEG